MTLRPAGTISTLLIAAAGALALAACASGPIDLASDAPGGGAITAQTQMRERAIEIAERVDVSGWTLRAPAGDAARSFLGRLIGGADTPQETPADPVYDYLAAHGPDSALTDMAALTEDVRALSAAVLAVASAERGLDPASLDADIAAAESALSAVRRASAFFEAVGEESGMAGDAADAHAERFDALVRTRRGLATAADALSERRWAARTGLVG